MKKQRYFQLQKSESINNQFLKMATLLRSLSSIMLWYIVLERVLAFYNVLQMPFIYIVIPLFVIASFLLILASALYGIGLAKLRKEKDFREYKHIKITAMLDALGGDKKEKYFDDE